MWTVTSVDTAQQQPKLNDDDDWTLQWHWCVPVRQWRGIVISTRLTSSELYVFAASVFCSLRAHIQSQLKLNGHVRQVKRESGQQILMTVTIVTKYWWQLIWVLMPWLAAVTSQNILDELAADFWLSLLEVLWITRHIYGSDPCRSSKRNLTAQSDPGHGGRLDLCDTRSRGVGL